jgi:hypothetical protein
MSAKLAWSTLIACGGHTDTQGYQNYYEQNNTPLDTFEKQSVFPIAPKFRPL